MREYLAALDEAEPIGAPPKYLSMTDPAARWTAAPGCPAFYAYSTNYLVDIEAGVIVDVEADGIDLAKVAAGAPGIKSIEPRGDGRWQVEAVSDVRPDLAKLVVGAGGSLKNLDLHRARLDQAYNRFFQEVRHEA